MTCSNGRANTISGSATSVPTFRVWKCHQLGKVGKQAEQHLSPLYKLLLLRNCPSKPQNTYLQGGKMLLSSLSTFQRAQVRQGVRSSTIQNATEPALSWAPAHTAPAEPAAELVLPALHKHGCVPKPLFWQNKTYLYWALQSQEAFCGSSKPNALHFCLRLWLLLWTCTTKCLCSAGIPVAQDGKLLR